MLKNNLTDAAVDNSFKVIVIEAVGDVFCSGHNLKDITKARDNQDNGESYFMNLFTLCS